MKMTAFLGAPLTIAPRQARFHSTNGRNVRTQRFRAQAQQPVMIQSPDSDGPPDLDGYFASLQKKASETGPEAPPITLGTGRASKSAYDGDEAATVRAAVKKAASSLGTSAQLCHVTLALDFSPESVADAVHGELGDIPVMGRSVNKKNGDGIIEVLLLTSAAGGGIQLASATATAGKSVDETIDDRAAILDCACKDALRAAAGSAIQKLSPEYPPTFLVYAHGVGARPGIARDAIDMMSPGVIAYGGSAAAGEDGWVVLSPGIPGERCKDLNSHTAVVAAVPGKISFLFSSVVKNWAQPKFTEALSYMTPNYTGDASSDLLTAIRYDDWDKFVYCLEKENVDVNHKWVTKQNQIPLLAACARLRTKMVQYLIERGADVHHRNDGGFTAAMYTRMLTEHDRDVVQGQLQMLEQAGAITTLTPEEEEKLKVATNGKIFQ